VAIRNTGASPTSLPAANGRTNSVVVAIPLCSAHSTPAVRPPIASWLSSRIRTSDQRGGAFFSYESEVCMLTKVAGVAYGLWLG
jgi:hypothetical protein